MNREQIKELAVKAYHEHNASLAVICGEALECGEGSEAWLECERVHAERAAMALSNLVLTDQRLDGAVWSPGALVSGSFFSDCSFIQLDARGVRFFDTRFTRCNFHGALLRVSELLDSTFHNCNLMQADFTGAKLWNVSFAGSDLRGARGLPRVVPVADLDAKLLDALTADDAYLIPKGEQSTSPQRWHLDALAAHWGAPVALRSSVGQATAAALVYFASTGMVPDFTLPVTDLYAGMKERAGRK